MITTPKPYEFFITPPPVPEGVAEADWKPQWVNFQLRYRGKELLKGQVSLAQLSTHVQAEVNKTISNHQAELRYNRSLGGLWNRYPIDWLWWCLQRLGFNYVAGGRSQTHIIHFFARALGATGVLVRFKGRAAGASFPHIFIAPIKEMMQGIEEGRYE